ncbi:hypothetical protein M422DRAFT_256220 [Sphaerobolus stellatus SS14]|uniref:Uncharacterized protein n=1 Tax=Sphaerobolus stellatus (strain SS14) TaxID=990650 RepID=A0A0C9VH99_SPHS4|nr:hypothetical protein M422DRAFT_256220 [Sphaerobolus stellatus SS14]
MGGSLLMRRKKGTSGRAKAISLSVGWYRLGSEGLVDDGATERLLTRTRLFTLAESLVGVESLAELPEKMTHGSIPPAERLAPGIRPCPLKRRCRRCRRLDCERGAGVVVGRQCVEKRQH